MDAPKISITLPSIHPAALDRALRNVRDATRSAHEVIVVSPFEPPRIGAVVWIPETKSTGCNAAHMAAMRAVTGEFVTGWVDDHYYVDGWDVLALAAFTEREAAFHAAVRASSNGSPKRPGPFELGLRHINPTHVGTEFGIYYPYFPFMRSADAREVGWLTDEYWTGFADSDLAMRVWDAGGRCEWTPEGLVIVHPDDQRKNMTDTVANYDIVDQAHCRPDDMALFIRRWAPKYGAGWDTSHLRGFNVDVTPERFPQFVDATGRSIYYNRPEYRAAVGDGG
jgi:hypothetical protein